MKRAMANSSPIMSASYLASLFEAKKTSYTACSTGSPTGDCKKSSTPDPTTLNALSRYKIHHGASNTWVSLSYSCHSMKKLARTCLLIESCMRKWIPNSLSSTNHLTIYLHKFFVKLPWTKNLSTHLLGVLGNMHITSSSPFVVLRRAYLLKCTFLLLGPKPCSHS